MAALRVLGAVRLSRSTDESTSPVRQRERVGWWASGNDAAVVHVAEDLGVSGAVSPFERPGLGPWLTAERACEWDILVAWKLDRLSRDAGDTHALLRFAEEHGKRIVCVDDGIDSASNTGRVFIRFAAIMAEVERTAIRERARASRLQLRRDGRWSGGAPAYGLRAVPRQDGPGYGVEIDPEAYPHVRYMAERIIAGDTMNSVARELNRRGVLTPQDLRRQQAGRPVKSGEWRVSSVRSVLTSESLRGLMSHNGRTVTGPDGMPVRSGDAIVTEAEWRELQRRLVDEKQTRRTKTPSMLLGVAFCLKCDARLYRQGATKRGRRYDYYRCSSALLSPDRCTGKAIRADVLDTFTEEQLLRDIGDIEITEKVLVPGSDMSTELDRVRAAIDTARREHDLGLYEGEEDAYLARVQALVVRRRELEATPHTPDRWEDVGTGETYRQAWARMDVTERRALLEDSGIRITAWAEPLQLDFFVPQDILERRMPGMTARPVTG